MAMVESGKTDYSSGPVVLAHDSDAVHFQYASQIEIAMGRALPQMEVRVNGLSIMTKTTLVADPDAGKTHQLPTIGNEIKNMFTSAKTSTVDKPILHHVNAVVKPGTMTLLLGQPGSGKSSLLKLLSGRFSSSKNVNIQGDITCNGVPQSDIGKRLPQFVSYVPQRDRHFPMLTVKETLQFAHECCATELLPRDEQQFIHGSPDENKAALEAARAMYQHYPSIVTKQLGLDHCQDTIVGDSMLRGVSGGERKRVTTGEMAFGNKFVTLMDEISTGLDSAATYDIVKTHPSIAQKLRKTVVMALLSLHPRSSSSSTTS